MSKKKLTAVLNDLDLLNDEELDELRTAIDERLAEIEGDEDESDDESHDDDNE